MTKFKNLPLLNHWANFNQTWHKASLGKWDLILFKEEPFDSHKDNNGFFLFFIKVMILSYVFIDLNGFLRWAMWPTGLLLQCSYGALFSLEIDELRKKDISVWSEDLWQILKVLKDVINIYNSNKLLHGFSKYLFEERMKRTLSHCCGIHYYSFSFWIPNYMYVSRSFFMDMVLYRILPFFKKCFKFYLGGGAIFFYLIVNLNLQKIKKWVTLIHLRKIGPL